MIDPIDFISLLVLTLFCITVPVFVLKHYLCFYENEKIPFSSNSEEKALEIIKSKLEVCRQEHLAIMQDDKRSLTEVNVVTAQWNAIRCVLEEIIESLEGDSE